MGQKNKKKSEEQLREPSTLRLEMTGLLLLMVGLFYYVCLLTYHPLDQSFSTYSSSQKINNFGGILGAYFADILFFIFGGAAYVLGFYFLLNGVLFLLQKRLRLRFLDLFVFMACSVFVAIFLHLEFVDFKIKSSSLRAGGIIGEMFGEFGETFLGSWGVYLFVLFGALVTFSMATRLSVVETVNSSRVVIGKQLGSFRGRFLVLFLRLKKYIQHVLKILFDKIKNKKIPTAPVVPSVPEPIIQTTRSKQKVAPIVSEETDDFPLSDFHNSFDQDPSGLEPKILERKDKKVSKKVSAQLELQPIAEGYQLPPTAFLDHEETTQKTLDKDSLKMNAKILEKKLKDFMIDGHVTEIHPGPVITMYEFQPAPGVKLSRIVSLSDDLSLAMNGRSVRIVAPLPNKSAVGIEIPNHEREVVWFKEVVEDTRFQTPESRLLLALGKDAEGNPYVADLQKMPHLLVAGATGSGKSVSINTMITSIILRARPDEVRMIMIDPKMIELSIYQDIPHLLLPVVTEPKKANLALKWAVREMERRYKLLSDVHARNIEGYNKKIDAGEYENKLPDINSTEEMVVHQGRLPYIVVIIDEFADLMMVASKEVEESVCRLAQKARAAGIHVILATQRPSVDVITGIIKANFPARIAFKVTSKHDARTILDTQGAENLLGMGDMLFSSPGSGKILRLHGALISETEIMRIVDFLKKQARPDYQEQKILAPVAGDNDEDGSGEENDEFYDQAVQIVTESRRVSISSIQRQFRIGYNRAARIVEQMEQDGIVSPPNGQGQRQVLANEI